MYAHLLASGVSGPQADAALVLAWIFVSATVLILALSKLSMAMSRVSGARMSVWRVWWRTILANFGIWALTALVMRVSMPFVAAAAIFLAEFVVFFSCLLIDGGAYRRRWQAAAARPE